MSASLDDFFAKKDKKKKKTSKFTAGDLLAPEETETKKKTKKKAKECEPTPARNSEPATDTTKPAELGEEWTEYVEEKETDYSGLRIQSIQIRDEDVEVGNVNPDKDGDGEDGEDGEDRPDTASGPWNASTNPPPQKEVVEPPPKKEELVAPPPPPAKTGGYVIPSKRNAPSAGPDPLPQSRYRRKKEAPNLKSEEDFPTLGGGPPDDAYSGLGSGRFEKVRSGGRQMDEQTSRGPGLELGNKYDALRGGAD